jgi:hypothetical protein
VPQRSRYIAMEHILTTSVPDDSETHVWPLRFVPYARSPRKNDAGVDRMAASIRSDSRSASLKR